VTPGKSGGGSAYRSGGTARRRGKSFGAAAFVGREGAPVVTGGGDEVLQLRRGEGVRKLQEIAGIGSSERSSPGRGGRQRCSVRIGAKGGASGGRRRLFGRGERWEGWALERRSRRGVKTGEQVEQRERGRVARRQRDRGEKGREKRGVRPRGAMQRERVVALGPDRQAAPATA
jgi:hypothetical protein